MIRVLVVLPFYGGSLPIGRFAAKGLEEAGCLVDTFEAPAFYSAFTAVKQLQVSCGRAEFLENSFLQLVSQSILAKVESFQPDLVFCLAQAPLTRQALKRLRQDNITTAMWFVEDFKLFTYWRAFAPYYDFFAVIQKEPFLEELDKIGVKNTIYLPLAALPTVHAPLTLTPVEQKIFGAELSFLGAGYPNRRKAFNRLAHFDFKIWGTEWENEARLAKLVQRKGERITPEDAVKIYNATVINLNLHSSVNTDTLVSNGDFVNPRTFELAACGAFQLVDKRSLLSELFKDDELTTFTSLNELIEKIQHYRYKEEERKKISHRAKERVLADHTYKKRMEQLLCFIKERNKNFAPPKNEPAFFAELPPDLKPVLIELLDTLKLPANVSFMDLVTAVRKREAVLSPVETAILFLDEWKKQYSK